jgi:hypothetical protein
LGLAEEAFVLTVELARAFIAHLERRAGGIETVATQYILIILSISNGSRTV